MTPALWIQAGTISARDALDKALDKVAFAKLPATGRALGPEVQLAA